MNTADIEKLCRGRRTVDLGCGRDKLAGAVGVDFAGNAQADVRHDLDVYPYPFPDGSFEVVVLRNVIEHVRNVVGLMEEIHRIGADGADVLVTTPHFSSLYSYQDPTHVRHLALDSLDYFTERTRHSNFYSSARFRMVARGLDFGRSFPFSTIARGLAALSVRKYEKHFAFVFPANSLWFHLQVVK
ncbi:MAG TPA: methyltransferase domain-containing protein [Burkholderiales bacterium]|nr:methyltransferase domain-containing protein [Burkholderiales bacterium]